MLWINKSKTLTSEAANVNEDCNIPFTYLPNVFQWTSQEIATLFILGAELNSGIGLFPIWHGFAVVIDCYYRTDRKKQCCRFFVSKVVVVNETPVQWRDGAFNAHRHIEE